VLTLPAVADKTFLVTIGDRSITGQVARDQLVGRWQVPVADVAVTTTGFDVYTGEAMAMGERTPIACLDAAASARMAVGEALTNLAAAAIGALGDVKLSANWMAAAGWPGEDARLYEAVRAVGAELCPALGLAIPVGKDSMSMRTVWKDGSVVRAAQPDRERVRARHRRAPHPHAGARPGSRPIAAAAGRPRPRAASPRRQRPGAGLRWGGRGATRRGRRRPSGGVLRRGQALRADGLLLAYHDRSDGGLYTTLAELVFASGVGLAVDLSTLAGHDLAVLFSEELGAVLQVSTAEAAQVAARLRDRGLVVHDVGAPSDDDTLTVRRDGRVLHAASRVALRALWSDTTWRMQRLRDDPASADEEHALRLDPAFRGLSMDLRCPSRPPPDEGVPAVLTGARPRVAILREQGVNGQLEMAAAFTRAGFEAVDVHMSDILAGRVTLDGFRGLAACGGFSYGDVLGAGGGWAKSTSTTRARARPSRASSPAPTPSRSASATAAR
jgi:phosphoribosylformylglycinamidine synthase